MNAPIRFMGLRNSSVSGLNRDQMPAHFFSRNWSNSRVSKSTANTNRIKQDFAKRSLAVRLFKRRTFLHVIEFTQEVALRDQPFGPQPGLGEVILFTYRTSLRERSSVQQECMPGELKCPLVGQCTRKAQFAGPFTNPSALWLRSITTI